MQSLNSIEKEILQQPRTKNRTPILLAFVLISTTISLLLASTIYEDYTTIVTDITFIGFSVTFTIVLPKI